MGTQIGFLGILAPFSQRLCHMCCILTGIDGDYKLCYYRVIKSNELMKYTLIPRFHVHGFNIRIKWFWGTFHASYLIKNSITLNFHKTILLVLNYKNRFIIGFSYDLLWISGICVLGLILYFGSRIYCWNTN